MIEVFVKSSAILLATLCAAWLLRRQSAAVRHLVWTAGLISALALPLLMPLLPPLRVDVPVSRTVGAVYDRPQSLTTTSWAVIDRPYSTSSETSAPIDPFLAIWLCGSAFAGILLLGGAARMAWLERRGQPITSERWLTAAADVARSLRLKRRVQLVHILERAILGTMGIFRGRVFLPHDAPTWTDERIRVVLAHELAHIKRLDWLIQLVAEFGRAIFWFNPLFWVACRQLRRESEHACDDAVLNMGIDGQSYAAHLLELARSLKYSNRAWSPLLAMAQRSHLERRFLAMLNPSLDHRFASWSRVVITCVAALCITVSVAAIQARPQQAGGEISGKISDSTGAFIPGVFVVLANLDATTKAAMETVSDEAGGYSFRGLPAGRYVFEASLPGFAPFHSRLIELKNNDAVRQNATLYVGSLSSRVEVTAPGTRKPAPAPTTAKGPQRIRIGGNVQAANLITSVKPDYPQSTRDAGIEGTVVLQGVIGVDGRVLSLHVLNEGNVNPDLANAARGAVSQWRYRPTLLNGQPVEVFTTIEVDFKLAQ